MGILPRCALLLGGFAIVAGCASAPPGPPAAPLPPPRAASEARPTAEERFKEALRAMAKHDADRDWSVASCTQIATLLIDAGGAIEGADRRAALARYDAGTVYQRCGMRAEAKAMFHAAVAVDPGLKEARVAVALADSTEALDKRDYEGARRILSAALVVDEASAPLLNQMALAHLAGASGGNANTNTNTKYPDRAALELARGIAERAIRIEPASAPLYNTLGLIEAKLRGYEQALAAFDRARALDPSLFEAHMNAGAIRLRAGAFAAAEVAYRGALAARPGDYDGRLGLSLALRAQIDVDDASAKARFDEADRALEAAIASEPARPEAYLNQAILLLEYGNGIGSESWERSILKAQDRLRLIMAMQGDSPAIAKAREVAKMALEDLSDMMDCKFGETEAERKAREQRIRVRAARDYLNADLGPLP